MDTQTDSRSKSGPVLALLSTRYFDYCSLPAFCCEEDNLPTATKEPKRGGEGAFVVVLGLCKECNALASQHSHTHTHTRWGQWLRLDGASFILNGLRFSSPKKKSFDTVVLHNSTNKEIHLCRSLAKSRKKSIRGRWLCRQNGRFFLKAPLKGGSCDECHARSLPRPPSSEWRQIFDNDVIITEHCLAARSRFICHVRRWSIYHFVRN